MKKNRVKSALLLLRSKIYVLVTDEETVVEADFKGFNGMMMVHAMKNVQKKLDEVIAQFGKSKKEKANGRNQRGRQSSSRNK